MNHSQNRRRRGQQLHTVAFRSAHGVGSGAGPTDTAPAAGSAGWRCCRCRLDLSAACSRLELSAATSGRPASAWMPSSRRGAKQQRHGGAAGRRQS
jgi:hypothetical protein